MAALARTPPMSARPEVSSEASRLRRCFRAARPEHSCWRVKASVAPEAKADLRSPWQKSTLMRHGLRYDSEGHLRSAWDHLLRETGVHTAGCKAQGGNSGSFSARDQSRFPADSIAGQAGWQDPATVWRGHSDGEQAQTAGPEPTQGDAEEQLLRDLSDRLKRIPGTATRRQFSRIMRSGRLRLTGARVTRLLQLLVEDGAWQEALQVVEWIASRESSSLRLDRRVLTTLVAALGYKRPRSVLQVIRLMLASDETWPDMPAFRACAVALGRAGRLQDLLQHPPSTGVAGHAEVRPLEPDIVVYNAILSACAVQKEWKGVKWVFKEMARSGLAPTEASFNLAIKVLCRAGRTSEAEDLLPVMEARGMCPATSSFKELVDALGRRGDWQGAGRMVQLMESLTGPQGPGPGSAGVYAALCRALCRAGHWQDAGMLVQRVTESPGAEPAVVTVTGMIRACEEAGRVEDACSLFAWCLDPGALSRPDEDQMLLPALQALNLASSPTLALTGSTDARPTDVDDEGKERLGAAAAHEQQGAGKKRKRPRREGGMRPGAKSLGLAPNIVLCNTMLKIYGRARRFKEAQELMAQVCKGRVGTQPRLGAGESRLSPDAHTWDAMLGSCVQCNEWEEAESVLHQMRRQGWPVTLESHAWVLDAALKAKQEKLADLLRGSMRESEEPQREARATAPLHSAAAAKDGSIEASSSSSVPVPAQFQAQPWLDAQPSASSASWATPESDQEQLSNEHVRASPGGTGEVASTAGAVEDAGGASCLSRTNPVLWYLEQVLTSGGQLDQYAWRYAIHSVGPALSAAAVHELLGVLRAADYLGSSRLAVLADLARGLASSGGTAETLAAVQVIQQWMRLCTEVNCGKFGLQPPGLMLSDVGVPPVGLLASVRHSCLRCGLRSEAALVEQWADNLGFSITEEGNSVTSGDGQRCSSHSGTTKLEGSVLTVTGEEPCPRVEEGQQPSDGTTTLGDWVSSNDSSAEGPSADDVLATWDNP